MDPTNLIRRIKYRVRTAFVLNGLPHRKNQQSGVRASVEGVEADGVRTCSGVDHRLLSHFDQSVVCVDR